MFHLYVHWSPINFPLDIEKSFILKRGKKSVEGREGGTSFQVTSHINQINLDHELN